MLPLPMHAWVFERNSRVISLKRLTTTNIINPLYPFMIRLYLRILVAESEILKYITVWRHRVVETEGTSPGNEFVRHRHNRKWRQQRATRFCRLRRRAGREGHDAAAAAQAVHAVQGETRLTLTSPHASQATQCQFMHRFNPQLIVLVSINIFFSMNARVSTESVLLSTFNLDLRVYN